MSFSEDGYEIFPGFVPEPFLSRLESGVIRAYHGQGLKVPAIRERLAAWGGTYGYQSVEELDCLVSLFESEDREAGYQASLLAQQVPSSKSFSCDFALMTLAGRLLDAEPEGLMAIDPQVLPNMPTEHRLLYKWHAESCYYPKRRNFLNVWFPLFRDKSKENGTMWVMPGSHLVEGRQFVEYQAGKNHFVQYEIPENELSSYEPVPIEAKRGDLVVFHRNLVHSSSENESKRPSYAGIMRIADVRGDLTLSAGMSVVPYAGRTGDYAVAGMEVDHVRRH